MNKITTLGIAAVGLMGFACSVDMGQPQEEVGSSETAIDCSNNNNLASFSIMAGMAVSAAMEMKRWLPQRDFECYADNTADVGADVLPAGAPDGLVDVPGKCIRMDAGAGGYKKWNMGLSPKAWPRCANRNCKYTYALLSLQNDSANGNIFGGQPLDAGVLRSRLKSYWDRQFTCINRPDNGTGDDCPVEYHDLAFWYKTTSAATCAGGYDFWFHSSKQGSNPPVPLAKPGQLHNMLIWAGGTDNQFLAFNNVNGDVKIDPTGGTSEGSSGSSGSCTVVSYTWNNNTSPPTLRCGSVSNPDYADPNLTLVGKCCQCNGINKTFVTGSQSNIAKCQ